MLFTSEHLAEREPGKIQTFFRLLQKMLSFWAGAICSTCVVYSKTIIHVSVGESGGYLHPLQ